MPTKSSNDLFVVDNSEGDWNVLNDLAAWTHKSNTFDIAIGYFEIGSLRALDASGKSPTKFAF